MIHFDKDEVIVKEIRGPKAAILLRILLVAALAILPLVLVNLFPASAYSFIVIKGSSKAFFIFAYSIWLLLVWVDFFVWWMRYCLHMIVLTDSRIFDLTKKLPFRRDVVSVRLEDIEDIKILYKNRLSRMSQIGKLTIVTAGSMYPVREISFDTVFEPESVRQLILNAQRVRRDKIATVTFQRQEVTGK